MSAGIDRLLETVHGEARIRTHRAADPTAELLLSHGAGGGIEAKDLAALAAALPAHGFTVHLLEQPWRRAGRKIATAPPTLDTALLAAAAAIGGRGPDLALVIGGRSAGARSAARCAAAAGAAAVLALSFPLHPPARPDRSRLPELVGSGVPTLVVQGERDAMGRPQEFPDDTDLVVVPGADHALQVLKRGRVSEGEAMSIVVEGVLEWLVRQLGDVRG